MFIDPLTQLDQSSSGHHGQTSNCRCFSGNRLKYSDGSVCFGLLRQRAFFAQEEKKDILERTVGSLATAMILLRPTAKRSRRYVRLLVCPATAAVGSFLCRKQRGSKNPAEQIFKQHLFVFKVLGVWVVGLSKGKQE